MDDLVDLALRRFFASRIDLFGEKSRFLRFECMTNFSSDGYNSRLVFGRMLYEADGVVAYSTPLALKVSPELSTYKGIFLMYSFINEIFFYSKVIPFFAQFRSFDHLFPRFYASQMEVNENVERMVLIYKNVQADGYRASQHKAFLDYDHLVLMVRKLGEFHSYSYMAKSKDPVYYRSLLDCFIETHFTVTRDMQYLLPSAAPRGMQPLYKDSKYSSRLSTVEEIVTKANEFMVQILTTERNHSMSVLCHGDYLRNNVLFQYEKSRPLDMKIIDMANCKLASPVLDLSLVLYLNASQKMRDEHWDDLVNEYCAALKSTFPECEIPTKKEIIGEFKLKSMYAYLIASYFLPSLLADDLNLASEKELTPVEYRECLPHEIPEHVNLMVMNQLGGSYAVEALTNILRDMIDRGFV